MPLIVFDIDGTLTDTTGVDDDCFARALESTLGIHGFDGDWASYPHATDTGLAREITRRTLNRDLPDAQLAALRAAFIALLRDQATTNPHRFARVPGSGELIDHLRRRPGTRVALATGAWAGSAQIKLDTARLNVAGLPIATSDDHEDRRQIILTAIARSLGEPPTDRTISLAREQFGPLIYVGDGVWDAAASRSLGMGFVGVRVRGDTTRLEGLGARLLCHGFTDLARTLALLDKAPESSWR